MPPYPFEMCELVLLFLGPVLGILDFTEAVSFRDLGTEDMAVLLRFTVGMCVLPADLVAGRGRGILLIFWALLVNFRTLPACFWALILYPLVLLNEGRGVGSTESPSILDRRLTCRPALCRAALLNKDGGNWRTRSWTFLESIPIPSFATWWLNEERRL